MTPPALIRKPGNDAGFFTMAGTTLATWGLGVSLLALRAFSAEQMLALPLFLVPIALGALIFALCSSNKQKREDSSHILCLALAGSLTTFALHGNYFYYGIAIALVLVNLVNYRDRLLVAPAGPTVLFVVFLAPLAQDRWAVACLCGAILLFTAVTCRRERQVAWSVFPLMASLYLMSVNITANSTLFAILCLAHVALVYFLRAMRLNIGVEPSERRVLLDDLVIAYALVLALKAATLLEPHQRSALVALAFLVAALVRHWAMCGRAPSYLQPTLLRMFWAAAASHAPMRTRSNLVAAVICLAAAFLNWPLHGSALDEMNWRVSMLILVSVVLRLVARQTRSFVQKDAAKLLLLFASILMFIVISRGLLKDESAGSVMIAALIQYVAIVLTVLASGRDLGLKAEGAWQSIFSGRALALIRRTRGRVFDVLSQAPIVGWMFHLGDKAASNLQGTFGTSKTWTISHYAICLAVALGGISMNALVQDAWVNRVPELAAEMFVSSKSETAIEFRASFAKLAALLAYAGLVFLAGAMFRLMYLRSLALILACFMLAIQAFSTMIDKNSVISVVFYPVAFCCLMAMFRILYRAPPKKLK